MNFPIVDNGRFPPNFAPPQGWCYLILEDVGSLRVLREKISASWPPYSRRDREYPSASIWVIDRHYSITREIVNIETGEVREYII